MSLLKEIGTWTAATSILWAPITAGAIDYATSKHARYEGSRWTSLYTYEHWNYSMSQRGERSIMAKGGIPSSTFWYDNNGDGIIDKKLNIMIVPRRGIFTRDLEATIHDQLIFTQLFNEIKNRE